MIAKLVKGGGFRGALEYDLEPEKGVLLDTNMAGETPRELAAEFGAIRELRPGLGKAVFHASLSAAPGEQLTDEQWREIGQEYLAGMGFTDNQYVISRHTDTEHEHIHILANRIGYDGQVVSDGHDYPRQERLMREIEREYDLHEVAPSQEAERHAPTKGEIEQSIRTGAPSTRQRLQALCADAAQGCASFTAYVERLADLGVDVLPTVQQHGAKLSGLQYSLDGVTMKGSDLGKAYAAGGIQKQGISYEQDRDGPTVERCRERAAHRAAHGPDRGPAPSQAPERGGAGRDAGTAGPSAGGLDGRDPPDLGRDRGHEPGRGQGIAGRDAGGADDRRGPDPGQPADRAEALRPDDPDRAGYSGARERILALAVPTEDRDPAGRAGGGQVSATGPDRSRAALHRHTAGLGVERFEISIRNAETGRDLHRTWDQAELEQSVGWLKRMNARGHDVSIRPAGEHSLVLVDGLTGPAVARMGREGWTPAATIESSPGRYQAWVKLSEAPVSAPVRELAARGLAQHYGGDPPSAGRDPVGRLAGFTNQEPEHTREDRQPYVLAHDCPGTAAQAAPAYIERIERRLQEAKAQQERQREQERQRARGA